MKVGQNSYGVPTPSEVANKYAGYCYYCGKPLNIKPGLDNILVYTDNVKERLRNLIEETRRKLRIDFTNILPHVSRFLEEEERLDVLDMQTQTDVEKEFNSFLGVPRSVSIETSTVEESDE